MDRRPRPARADDLPAVAALLEQAGLTRAGLSEQFPGGFAVVDGPQGPCGAAGVELYGPPGAHEGLLRSLVVAPAARGQGLGAALVRDRVAWAGARGVRRLWLLTLDQGPFFQRLGFQPAQRAAAPPAVAGSLEFQCVCPASAACFSLDLPAR